MKTSKRKRQAAPAAEQIEQAKTAPETPAASPTVVLPSHCSVKDAARLSALLQEAVAESAVVTLDIGAVERVDAATMQLLCAFVRDRSARTQQVNWRGGSSALSEAVKLLGLGEILAWSAAGSTGDGA